MSPSHDDNSSAGAPERVYIVDDDASFRRSLDRLLTSHGFPTTVFGSAEAFLSAGLAHRQGCLVLDVHMPGLTGLDLQGVLERQECTLPVVFLTGRGDIPMSVRAMKAGAADFLTKPVDEDTLLQAVRKALGRSRREVEARREADAIRARIRTLTEREHEVMRQVLTGQLNKQIGGALGIAEKTVKIHRGRVMEKLGVTSVAELVQLCTRAGIEPAPVRADG
ncbi:MAG: response regulator [Kiritimatiellia bacterium]